MTVSSTAQRTANRQSTRGGSESSVGLSDGPGVRMPDSVVRTGASPACYDERQQSSDERGPRPLNRRSGDAASPTSPRAPPATSLPVEFPDVILVPAPSADPFRGPQSAPARRHLIAPRHHHRSFSDCHPVL